MRCPACGCSFRQTMARHACQPNLERMREVARGAIDLYLEFQNADDMGPKQAMDAAASELASQLLGPCERCDGAGSVKMRHPDGEMVEDPCPECSPGEPLELPTPTR